MNNEWIDVLSALFSAKKYDRDMLYDSFMMITHQMNALKADDFDRDRARKYIDAFKIHIRKPEHRYRMYIITGILFVSFAWIDIESDLFDKVNSVIKNEFSGCAIMPAKKLDPDLVSTLYVFDGEQILYTENIYPAHLAWLLTALSKYNVIKYKIT